MSSVIDRVRAIAFQQPDAIAIACAGEPVLGYRALWDRACAIAGALRAAGIGRGDIVALHLEKSPAWIAAALGTWCAGAAWVPVLPDSTEHRRQLILDETRARVAIVASDRVPDWLSARCAIVGVTLHPSNRSTSLAFCTETYKPEDPAYVIYTSGSTGQPKGVIVAHRGLVAMLDAQIAAFELRACDRCLWVLSPGFDASVSDVGTALLAGAELHIEHPARLRSAAGLLEVMHQRAITHCDLPPSLLPLLSADRVPSALRTLIVGGEVCAPVAIRVWASHVRVVNVYGPTEATVCSTLQVCDPSWERPLIGQPLPHVTLAIEGEELWIGGPGVADGYLDRPALQAAKFVERDGLRWFRTGDRVVRHADGELEFLGRIDRQLKIQGVLVAPEEIEARLREVPGVVEAAVTCERIGSREGLVAYVVGKVEPRGVRAQLARVLDARLMPRRFLVVEEIPHTASGKVDFDALARARAARIDHSDRGSGCIGASTWNPTDASATASTSTERSLAAIWTQLVGGDPRLDDDFFEMGGDSLAVIELIGLAELAGLAVSAENVYAHPTLGGLARAIATAADTERDTAMSCDDLVADIADIAGSADIAGPADIAHTNDRASSDDLATATGRAGTSDIACGLSPVACRLFPEPAREWLADSSRGIGGELQRSEGSVPIDHPAVDNVGASGPARFGNRQQATGDRPQAMAVDPGFGNRRQATGDRRQAMAGGPGAGAILLTGATGFLGSHVLDELLDGSDAAIVCLVRGESRRIDRGSRVICVHGDLGEAHFGLDDRAWAALVSRVSTIVHCAAEVSLAKPYGALRAANVVGTANVLALARLAGARVHHASTLSVFVGSDRTGTLREPDALDTAGRLHGGYAQSKWAAEWLAREARATIARFGLLTGDTQTGRAPERDWLGWFIRGLARAGAYPIVRELRVDITPIDHAARAFAMLVLGDARGTFHIANETSATLADLIAAIARAGVPLRAIAADAWSALLAAHAGDELHTTVAALLGVRGDRVSRTRPYDVFQATGMRFDTARTIEQLGEIGRCPAPTAALLDRYVARALEAG